MAVSTGRFTVIGVQTAEWAGAAELMTMTFRRIPRHPTQQILDLDLLAKKQEVNAHDREADLSLGRTLLWIGLLLLRSMFAV